MNRDRVTYELPIGQDYVRAWGVKEAVRELIQNALDSPAPFEFSFLEGTFAGQHTLVITSRGVSLDASTLVLGSTSKADDTGKIGSFGEGYKLALLVLTRCGKSVIVRNGGRVWTPEIRISSQYRVPVLHVISERVQKVTEGLQFIIGGLTEQEVDEIRDGCLQMQSPSSRDWKFIDGYGAILTTPEHAHKLYVGGLLVCATQLDFGYNLHPNQIKLERDRQTVSSFDLKWRTKEMWMSCGDPDFVAELIERNCPDTSYVEYGCPEEVAEACYRLFNQRNPGGNVAKSQKECDELVERGLTKVVYVNSAFHAAVSTAPGYVEGAGRIAAVLTPEQELRKFEEDFGHEWTAECAAYFTGLHIRSKGWRNK